MASRFVKTGVLNLGKNPIIVGDLNYTRMVKLTAFSPMTVGPFYDSDGQKILDEGKIQFASAEQALFAHSILEATGYAKFVKRLSNSLFNYIESTVKEEPADPSLYFENAEIAFKVAHILSAAKIVVPIIDDESITS